MTRIALTGGGTAGHITPLIAVAEAIGDQADCVVIGTTGGREAELLPEGLPIIHQIDKLPFPRKFSAGAVAFPFRWIAAVVRARAALSRANVDAVVGFGGYTAAPAYLAAWLCRIPLVIHEANAIPGLANRLGARLARRVGVCFPGTPLPGADVVGMPLRPAILGLDRRAQRSGARRHFGLRPRKPVVLVTGGSTGARTINATIDATAGDIVSSGWQVLHLRGPGQDGPRSAAKGVVAVDYTDRMDLAMAAADLVISRAGAATVSELGVVGLPAVFVPYHVGNGEQRLNAAIATRAGGALMVETAQFTPEWVRKTLVPLLAKPDQIDQMAQAMAATGKREGASIVASWALDAARSRSGGFEKGRN